jgi:hypothetical protein
LPASGISRSSFPRPSIRCSPRPSTRNAMAARRRRRHSRKRGLEEEEKDREVER